MADIPLAQDDKGNVIGWDGKSWRPPDDIAEDATGRRAYRFGRTWQIGPETAAPLAGALPSNDSLLDKGRVVGTAAVQGATDAIRMPSAIDDLGMSGMNWLLRKVGLISKTREQQEAALRRAGVTPLRDVLPSVTKTVESVGIPTDPRAEAKRLGVEYTPGMEAVSSGVRTATGAALTGGGLPMSILSGVGAGVGRRIGGETGELVGAIGFPLAATGVGILARAGTRAARSVTQPFTERGRQAMADRAILEAAGDTPQNLAASMRTAPLPGQPATLGQLTGNRGLLDAEYVLHGKLPAIEDAYRRTSQLAGQEMRSLAPLTERQGSEALRAALTTARQSAHAKASAAFRPIDAAMAGLKTPRNDFAAVMKPFFRDLSKAELDDIPGNIRGTINMLAQTKAVTNGQPVSLKTFRLKEITGLRSTVASAAREALQAGNANRHRLLTGIVGKLDEYVDSVVPQFVPGYSKARDTWRQFKRAYDKDPELGVLFAKNADGSYKIPASEVGSRVLRMSPEAIGRLAKLPGIKPRLRDWLAAEWTERAVTANAAARVSGEPVLHGALKFRQDYAHIFKAAFDANDLRRADSIIEALKMPTMAEFGQRRFGSPTYNKFVKGTLIEGMIGRILGHIPGGGMLNQAVGSWIYSRPIAELEAKIAESLLNPQSTVARLLHSKATPGNLKLLSRYWRMTPVIAAPAASRGEE